MLLGSPSRACVFEVLDRGARCESCDWDIPIRERDPYLIHLPDIQATRQSARILVARARLQIAYGRYDEAVQTLRTGYSFGRHVAQGPTLINSLVGGTIARMMSKQVETFIQQPDAPNLYWALASLPRPVVDFRPGYDAEMAAIYLSFPELRDLDKKSYPAEYWRQLLQQTVEKMLVTARSPGGTLRRHMAYYAGMAASMLEGYPRAKRFLIARGRSSAEIEAMPVAQVILLYTVQNYDEAARRYVQMDRDALPRGAPGDRAGVSQDQGLLSGREIIPLTRPFPLLEQMEAFKRLEAVTDRGIAALEVLEASGSTPPAMTAGCRRV